MKQCYDDIRFWPGDRSGRMRFEPLDVADMPECQDVGARLRECLVGRPPAEGDVDWIASMESDDRCTCLGEAARVVREQQPLFDHTGPPRRT